jgi:hypothetical protein
VTDLINVATLARRGDDNTVTVAGGGDRDGDAVAASAAAAAGVATSSVGAASAASCNSPREGDGEVSAGSVAHSGDATSVGSRVGDSVPANAAHVACVSSQPVLVV